MVNCAAVDLAADTVDWAGTIDVPPSNDTNNDIASTPDDLTAVVEASLDGLLT
jgi:hypothetical protein